MPMLHYSLTTTAVSLAVMLSSSFAIECSFDSGLGASYDLSTLTISTNTAKSSYDVRDRDFESGDAYHYHFNVCENIPVGDDSYKLCKDKGRSAAYQIYHRNSSDFHCYSLSADLADKPSSMTFALHDSRDPSAGVVLSYTGGEKCLNGVDRKLDLHFMCRDDQNRETNLPDEFEEFLQEPSVCEYSMEIKTGHACPKECKDSGGQKGQVCGSAGVCGYDTDKKVARCFCDEGLTGETCSQTISVGGGNGGISGEYVALIIVCILLVGVLGLLGYMGNKLRRLQLDPDSYAQLGNKFNELGQVSAVPI